MKISSVYISCPMSVLQTDLDKIIAYAREYLPINKIKFWNRSTIYSGATYKNIIKKADAFILVSPKFKIWTSELTVGCKREIQQAIEWEIPVFFAYPAKVGWGIYETEMDYSVDKKEYFISGIAGSKQIFIDACLEVYGEEELPVKDKIGECIEKEGEVFFQAVYNTYGYTRTISEESCISELIREGNCSEPNSILITKINEYGAKEFREIGLKDALKIHNFYRDKRLEVFRVGDLNTILPKDGTSTMTTGVGNSVGEFLNIECSKGKYLVETLGKQKALQVTESTLFTLLDLSPKPSFKRIMFRRK